VLQVQSDRSLSPVGSLEVHVDTRVEAVQTSRDQAAIGIARLGMFDLDHLGPPVGQHGTGDGNEHV
jgi:hypothetical protein